MKECYKGRDLIEELVWYKALGCFVQNGQVGQGQGCKGWHSGGQSRGCHQGRGRGNYQEQTTTPHPE